MSEGCTKSICTAGSLPFQQNCFNLLHADNFRDEGYPWPHGRSIFWLWRDWCMFFDSVADNFSSQPAVASMPICIPWPFQSVSNSLYSPRLLTFSGFCSVTGFFWSVFSFLPRCVKVTCLENSNRKMREKVWLPCSWLQAVALVLAIQLKQVRSLAHPALCSMSGVKFGTRFWESSKLTSSLLRLFAWFGTK